MSYLAPKELLSIDTDTTLCNRSQTIIATHTEEIDVTLTASPEDGQRITIRNAGSESLFVDPNGNDLDGSTDSVELAVGEVIELIYSDDLEWRTIN